MRALTKEDLVSFQKAIFNDHGIKLEGKDLYEAAFNLLEFFKALIKFDRRDKEETGSKTVHDNPLITDSDKDKIK